MKKLVLSASITALLSANTFAQDYQFEGSLFYSFSDLDDAGLETDAIGIEGIAHFGIVDTTKGPLREAAFLDKSSFVSFGYSTLETDIDNTFFEIDTDVIDLGARIVYSDVIVELSYSDIEAESNGVDADDYIFSVGVGYYLDASNELIFSYGESDETDLSFFSVAAHGLFALEDQSAIAYDISYTFTQDDLTDNDTAAFEFGGDYYFNKATSVGVNYVFSSTDVDAFGQDTIETHDFTLNAAYFVTPNVFVEAFISEQIEDNEGTAYGLEAGVRF